MLAQRHLEKWAAVMHIGWMGKIARYSLVAPSRKRAHKQANKSKATDSKNKQKTIHLVEAVQFNTNEVACSDPRVTTYLHQRPLDLTIR